MEPSLVRKVLFIVIPLLVILSVIIIGLSESSITFISNNMGEEFYLDAATTSSSSPQLRDSPRQALASVFSSLCSVLEKVAYSTCQIRSFRYSLHLKVCWVRPITYL
ncbi:uncharacterized protein K441DRAFT_130288 [Cenococcum geophilum 1.58]|uniref:uncharacterized protein n=1 Tax=Cenococcum geophilum 1.58 TaxID=794803 RepID=UPI00358F0B1B|nr:hypothetical protein K441DRAFT_130288 [Cenococcum geophilum 1.58]